jgi:hypothetical protein
MIEYGASDGDGSKASQIFSVSVSIISILYGLSTWNLRIMLRNEPNIKNTILFTLTELSTSTVIFLYLPSSWTLIKLNWIGLDVVYVLLLYGLLPISACLLSLLMLKHNIEFFTPDNKLNLFWKCKELDSFADMLRSRRSLVLVNMIVLLITTSSMTITLYLINQSQMCIIPFLRCENEVVDKQFRLMVVISLWYSACIISFLQNAIELLFIVNAKRSFIDWAFKAGLEKQERLDRLKDIAIQFNDLTVLMG